MTLRHTVCFIGMALICLVSTAHAATPAPIGQVVSLRGPVTADLLGKSRSLAIKSPVFQDDTIRTESRSRVQILFNDNTIITLGVSSSLHLKTYQWNAATKEGAFTHEVKEGVFRVLGGAITQSAPEKFKTETPVATIGIRGSLYQGQFRDGLLTVILQGGKGINIINETGVVPITTAGFGTKVGGLGEKPAKPSRFTRGDMTEMNEGLAATESEGSQEENTNDSGTDADQGTAGEAPYAEETSPQSDTGSNGSSDNGVAAALPTVDRIPLLDVTPPLPDNPPALPDNPPPPPSVALSGKGGSAVADATGQVSSYTLGGVTASLQSDGTVTGTITGAGGTSRSFAYQIPNYTPNAPYTDFTFSKSIVNGVTRNVQSSPSGEFSIVTIPGPTSYELGFAGTPATTTPTDGVDFYFGNMLAVDNSSASSTPGDKIHFGDYGMEINWRTNTYIAHFKETSGTGNNGGPVIFGNISGTSLATAQMIGPTFGIGDAQTSMGVIEWGNLTGPSGGFYGTSTQGLGFSATGTLVNIQTQTDTTGNFEVVGAAMLKPGTDNLTSPTGTATFNGFVTGIAENMADPGTNRGIFLNSSASDVTIALNRDTGTVTGSLTAQDLAGSLGVVIGPSGQSAYVVDNNFAAYLGSGPAASANITTLKPYGNFLITAPRPDPAATSTSGQQFSDHVTWGYWEVAYVDPGSGNDYHLHNPGSLWIAGETTPYAALNSLRIADFTGTYIGGAEGIQIDPTGTISMLTGGKTNMVVYFGSVGNITGTINFDQLTTPLTLINGYVSISPTGSGFFAEFSGLPSQVTGTFFGPNANAIGGNFKGENATALTQYVGIFGGNLQP